ncbi:MAG: hypothetical protein R6V56_08620 [Lentisphaeria bacterium]
MMKEVFKRAGMFACAGIIGFAGNAMAQEAETETAEVATGLWAKPISNPVYTDLAIQKREINLVYIFNPLPSHVDSSAGNISMDGDLQALALQAEIPIMENLSFVANKSGAISFRPDNDSLAKEEGWANLSGGLKWSFFQNEMLAAALRGTVEIPSGDTEVLQGNGRGSFSPAVLLTHMTPRYAVNGVLGATVPFDSSELSSMGYASLSSAYRCTDKMSALLELNWFRVLEAGHGETDFNEFGKEGHNVLEFEGGDLINLGAADSEKHADFVSMAVGARYQLTDRVNVGVAYELPLTAKDRSLMDERVTLDVGMTF